MRDLQGKVAVITGAGSGIGEGLARRLSREGMSIVIADLALDQAERVTAEIRTSGGTAIAVEADVRDVRSMISARERAYDEFGAVHLLCNNAGILLLREIGEMTNEDWRTVIDVDLFGPINGLQAFLPPMLAQGEEAHIVNTASAAGVVPLPGMGLGAYSAAKHGVVGLSEILRAELAPHRIGVSVLCPMGVATPMLAAQASRAADVTSTNATSSNEVEHAGSRANERAEARQQPPIMTPAQVAHVIVEGIRANRAYIMPHPELAVAIRERFEGMLQDCEQQLAVAEEARRL